MSPCHNLSTTNVIPCTRLFNSYQASDLVKLDILINGQPVDAMATIVHSQKAQRVGRELVDKLKKHIDRCLDLVSLTINSVYYPSPDRNGSSCYIEQANV